jgi:hypothetical protein
MTDYAPPRPHELAKLTPAEFATEWALADDAGESLNPRTAADYCALWEQYPERLRKYKPAPEWVAFLQLPDNWGREPEPLSVATQESIVATLVSDDRFRRAVAAVLAAEGGAV